MKSVLLLKPGRTSSRAVLGDYESWFGAAVEGLARLHPVELHEGERPPPLEGFDAVIMTGSPLSVIDAHATPWMREAADYLLAASERVPVLGVCFGHQLLAWKLGAPVRRNPRGRELGTVEVQLRVRDPLFAELPDVVQVQATHDDEVAALPDGAELLATNEHCAVQAFAHGPRLRAVQFHPEMNAASIGFCIDHPETAAAHRARARARESLHGAIMLRNFVTLFPLADGGAPQGALLFR
jgi:GMP synthase (glutamine-hydrolysing)